MTWTCVRLLSSSLIPTPLTPIIFSSSSAYRLCSCSGPVSELDCDRCSVVPQRLGPEQCCQSQHPLLRGAEWDKCQKTPPGRKGDLVQLTYPTKDSITLYHIPFTLSEPLGRARFSHHNYPVQISPHTSVMCRV